jgi:hypothetical protein
MRIELPSDLISTDRSFGRIAACRLGHQMSLYDDREDVLVLANAITLYRLQERKSP